MSRLFSDHNVSKFPSAYVDAPNSLSLIVISTQMQQDEQQRCISVAEAYMQHQENPFDSNIPTFNEDDFIESVQAPSLRALCVSRFLNQPLLSLQQLGYTYADFLAVAGYTLDTVPQEYKYYMLQQGKRYDDAWSRGKYKEMVQYCKEHGAKDKQARANALGLDATQIAQLSTYMTKKAAEFKKVNLFRRDSQQSHLRDTIAGILHGRGIRACMFLDDSIVPNASPYYIPRDVSISVESIVKKLIAQEPINGEEVQYMVQTSSQGSISCCEQVVMEKKQRVTFGPLVTVEYDAGLVQQKRQLGNFHSKSPLIQSVIGAKNAQASKPVVQKSGDRERALTWKDQDEEEAETEEKSSLLGEIVPDHVRMQREQQEQEEKARKQQIHQERVDLSEKEKFEKLQAKFNLEKEGDTVITQDGEYSQQNGKIQKTLRIFDGTAGFGTDAFLQRSCVQDDLNVRITLMERNPVMFLLLSDGLRRAMLHTPQEEPLENKDPVYNGTLQPFTTDKTDATSQNIIKIANDSLSQFQYTKPKGNQSSIHQKQASLFARDMTVQFGDSTQYLYDHVLNKEDQLVKSMDQREYDVVYIDPFYPMKQTGKHAEEKKQARNTKLMSLAKVLKSIYHQDKIDETLNTDQLKKLGRLACTQRCVIKRPSHADKPKEKNLLTYSDRKTRFDVNTPIGNVKQATALYKQLLPSISQMTEEDSNKV